MCWFSPLDNCTDLHRFRHNDCFLQILKKKKQNKLAFYLLKGKSLKAVSFPCSTTLTCKVILISQVVILPSDVVYKSRTLCSLTRPLLVCLWANSKGQIQLLWQWTPFSGHGKTEWPLIWGRVIIVTHGNGDNCTEGLLWARNNATHSTCVLSSNNYSGHVCVCVCSIALVMSDSLWSHGLWPTRLLCIFPGHLPVSTFYDYR